MKNIGMFGGSFNPPHNGHLIVCQAVLDQVGLDKIIFIPSAIPPHKLDMRLAPAEMRLEMVKLATVGNPGFDVSDIELRRGGTSYTVDTLKGLQQQHPDSQLHLLIGADNWVDFETWRMPDQIMQLAQIVVMTRPGFAIERFAHRYGRRVRFGDVPNIGISGTMIRLNIKSGRSVKYLVPPQVEHFLDQHALYHEKVSK